MYLFFWGGVVIELTWPPPRQKPMHATEKHIREKYPSAVYVHCASHSLNLCLEKGSNIVEIASCITLMRDIISFFRDSNKRIEMLKQYIDENFSDIKKDRLKKFCPTQWVESQESTLTFKTLYPAIKGVLGGMANGNIPVIGEIAGKAQRYMKGITRDSFIVCLKVLSAILSITRPVSVLQQGVDNDILKGIDTIETCEKVLEKMRHDDTFSKIFNQLEDDLGEEIQRPRVVSRQTTRSNPPSENAFEYYKRAIFLPYIDTIISQIRERFREHKRLFEKLAPLMPNRSVLDSMNFEDDLEASILIYQKFLPGDIQEIGSEFKRWQLIWREKSDKLPVSILDAYKTCKELGSSSFPNIEVLLKIFATLPLTMASSERSFSALKYVKNYLRSTMNETRLNGLSVLYIHKDIALDTEAVIDELGRKNRLLKLN